MTEKGAFAAMLVSRAQRNPRAAFALVCGTAVVLLIAALGVGWCLGSADDGRIATLSKTAAAWPNGDVPSDSGGPVTRYEDYLGIMVGTFFLDESGRQHCVMAGNRRVDPRGMRGGAVQRYRRHPREEVQSRGAADAVPRRCHRADLLRRRDGHGAPRSDLAARESGNLRRFDPDVGGVPYARRDPRRDAHDRCTHTDRRRGERLVGRACERPR